MEKTGKSSWICQDHSGCIQRLDHLEAGERRHSTKLDKISTKLNYIIGGIILTGAVIAPLLVSMFQVLMRVAKNL